VMGVTGSGKTTFVNQVSGSCLEIGDDLESCTSKVQESEEFILDGKRVVLVDTPGFDDTHKTDTEVLKSIAGFLGETYSVGAKLTGVIYTHRISDIKFGGLAVKNFKMFRELCGENTLKNVVLVTNMWGLVTSDQQGAAREQQLKDKYFKAAIEKGAKLCRYNNDLESGQGILREILGKEPVVLKIQEELIDEGKDIGETGAVAELKRGILEVEGNYKREIKELDENMQRAEEERDEESRREFEEERRRMQEEMEDLQKDCEEMESKFDKARREMEERMNARVRYLRGKYEAEIQKYRERVKELESEGNKNASEIKKIKEKMAELEEQLRKIYRFFKKCTIM